VLSRLFAQGINALSVCGTLEPGTTLLDYGKDLLMKFGILSSCLFVTRFITSWAIGALARSLAPQPASCVPTR